VTDEGPWAPHTHAGEPVPLAWVRLLSAHAAITRELSANLLAAHGLTASDYEVLLHLSWAPDGRLRRSELAGGVLLTQGGITRLLHGLEREDLVRSTTSEADRRVVHAQLTPNGRERLAQAAGTHVADIRRLFTDRFSSAELRALARLLGALPGTDIGPATTPEGGS
jgi:DNA-binding MarR family transcriptional regulator